MYGFKVLFEKSKTEEERKNALGQVKNNIESIKRNRVVSSLVFNVTVFINLMITFFGTVQFLVNMDEEDIVFFETLPEFIKKIVNILYNAWDKIYVLFEKIFLDTDISQTAGMIISIVLVAIAYCTVIPLVVAVVTRIILTLIPNLKVKEPDDIKEYYAEVYKLVKSNGYMDGVSVKATSIIAEILFYAYILYLVFKYDGISFIMIIGAAILAVILYFGLKLILFLLFILPKSVFSAKTTFWFSSSETETFEESYAEIDENFKQQLERRKAEAKAIEERRTAEMAKQAEEEASAPKVRFNTGGISNANRLTVYIDDEKITSFDGGQVKTVKVPKGQHKMQVQVYNDASETAYWLDPVYNDFEAYETYDIDYN